MSFPDRMWAAVLERPYELSLQRVPVPAPGPGEVLVQVMATGICGTDGEVYRGQLDSLSPIILGHEYAGIVAAVGPSVVGVREGEREPIKRPFKPWLRAP